MIRASEFEKVLEKTFRTEMESLEKELQRLEKKKTKTQEDIKQMKIIQRKLDLKNPLRKI